MLLFLDIETTGLDAKTADIIELSAVRFDGEKVVATFDELVRYDDPDFCIPPLVEKITGLTVEILQEGRSLAEVQKDFLEEFLRPDDVIVGHNISFDTGFLREKGFVFENAEIDTYPLSTLLLPAEESHSLEILTKKYELPHQDAHRALSDVLANLELWKLLQKVFFADFPKPLRQQYYKLLEKTDWPGGHFFLDCQQQEATENAKIVSDFSQKDISVPLKKLSQKTKQERSFQNNVFALFEQQKKVLWEVSSSFPSDPFLLAVEAVAAFAKQHHVSIGITFAPRQQQLVESLMASCSSFLEGVLCARFHTPEEVLCETRWNEFLQQTAFSDLEFLVACKVLRELQKKNGAVPNIKHEEWSVWQRLSSLSHPHCTDECPGKNYSFEVLAKKYQIFFVPEHHFRSFFGKHVLVCNAENLENILTNVAEEMGSSRKIRSLLPAEDSELVQRVHFFFDLLGGFLRKEAGENTYPVDILVSEKMRQTADWQQFSTELKVLSEEIKTASFCDERLKGELQIWQDFFSVSSGEIISWWKLFPDDEVACVRAPVDLEPSFSRFLEEYDAALFFGSHFPKTPEKEWAFSFCLPSALETGALSLQTEENFARHCTFLVPERGVITKNSPEEAAEWLEQILRYTSGNVLAYFSSQRSVEQVEELLFAFCAQEKIHPISHRSGGRGKIQKFLRCGERLLLLATPSLFRRISLPEEVSFSVFFFQKFIFDPPGNVLEAARRGQFGNGFAAFTLPRTLGRFEAELYRLFEQQSESFSFLCFDPRWWKNNGYGGAFSALLPEGVVPQEISLDQLSSILSQ